MQQDNQRKNNTQEQDVNRLIQVRREKLAELQAAGEDPFQITKFDVTHHSEEIRENYASKLTLKSMSEKYFINSAYLGQLFIRKHQMTFNAFLWNERLSHAAFQLAHTNKFIYEIIEDVGCSNVNYFNRQFSRKYGVSPYTYRKNTAPNKAQ